MDKDELIQNGWKAQEVAPGNCIKERWNKEENPLKAEIMVTNQGEVSGLIRAAEDLTKTRIKGQLVLKELQSPVQAAQVINSLMAIITSGVPYQDSEAASLV